MRREWCLANPLFGRRTLARLRKTRFFIFLGYVRDFAALVPQGTSLRSSVVSSSVVGRQSSLVGRRSSAELALAICPSPMANGCVGRGAWSWSALRPWPRSLASHEPASHNKTRTDVLLHPQKRASAEQRDRPTSTTPHGAAVGGGLGNADPVRASAPTSQIGLAIWRAPEGDPYPRAAKRAWVWSPAGGRSRPSPPPPSTSTSHEPPPSTSTSASLSLPQVLERGLSRPALERAVKSARLGETDALRDRLDRAVSAQLFAG